MIKEEWRLLKLTSDYLISNLGRCKSVSRLITEKTGKSYYTKEKLLKNRITSNGYSQLCIRVNGKYSYLYTHRMVAEAFIGDIKDLEVNHKDGNKQNNIFSNLEIVNHKNNTEHAKINKLYKSGENHGNSNLTNEIVKNIKLKYNNGKKTVDIAKEFNIPYKKVWAIVKGKIYKYV